MPTVHLLIKGKVQGVFYRATAQKIAKQLGITGWVKNTDDGNVEVMATGDEPSVEKLIKWCKQGPKRAEVTDVIITPKPSEQFPEFSIIR